MRSLSTTTSYVSRNTPSTAFLPTRPRVVRVPVDDAVVVAVDAGADEVHVRELAARVAFFQVAVELHPAVAQVEAVGSVPVIVDRRRRVVGGRERLAAVDDERQTEDQRRRDGQRENGAALEADLLAFALGCQLGGLLGRRGATCHGRQAIGAIAPSPGSHSWWARVGHELVICLTDGSRRRFRLGPCAAGRPVRSGHRRVVDEPSDRLDEGVQIVRRHRDAAAGRCQQPGDLGVGVDRRHDRTTRRETRVRLRRHADVAEPGAERNDVHVAGRQHFREPFDGLVAGESDVRHVGRRTFELLTCGSVTVHHERHVRAPSRCADDEVERLREPDVARVQHDGLVADARIRIGSGSNDRAGRSHRCRRSW